MMTYDQEERRYREAHAAIRRLEETLGTGDNRFGEYGRNVRDAIERQRETIRRIEAERAREGRTIR
jgi:hypothetical protein